MGTTLLGDNYLFWVQNSGATAFNYVDGQGAMTVNRSASDIDLSSKTDGRIAAAMPGRQKVTIDLDLKPRLPDSGGYTRLETFCQAYPKAPFEVQVRKNGTSGATGDVVFDAMVYGNIDSTSFPQDGAAAAKITLTVISITTDTLA